MESKAKRPDKYLKKHAGAEKLRVAAYCRVSTDSEEQASSLVLQEAHFTNLINGVSVWSNAGVFTERVTGLRERKRTEFMKLMKLCEQNKVDLILVKSISRFGRNTLEMLQALQKIDALGVDVYFEVENIWLHDRKMQVFLTAYLALAQAESENKSQNIKWGVRRGFETGTSGYADFVCFGYKAGDNGQLAIDEPDAKVVRKIFDMRADGASLGAISDWLFEQHIASPSGKERWSRETLRKLLNNEKYTGDVVLQKTYVEDLFSGKQIENKGQLDRQLITDHHPAIVDRSVFRKASPDAFREIYGGC